MDFWTAERVEIARDMHAKGHTCREIGAVVGTTRNAVIGKLHRLGIARPTTADQWTHDRLATLRRMHIEGATYEEISEATGFCVAACRQKASRVGLPSRGNVHYVRAKSSNKPRGFRPKVVEGIEAPSLELAAGILDVTGCKWPVGENDLTPGRHLFCNHGTEENAAYCPYHAELNRARPVPVAERKRFVIPTTLLRAVA